MERKENNIRWVENIKKVRLYQLSMKIGRNIFDPRNTSRWHIASVVGTDTTYYILLRTYVQRGRGGGGGLSVKSMS